MAFGVSWCDGCCGFHAKLYDVGQALRLRWERFPAL